VTRSPYGILDLFGDIGGLYDFFILSFTVAVGMFPVHRISARLAQ
jgi:hypothetical protein